MPRQGTRQRSSSHREHKQRTTGQQATTTSVILVQSRAHDAESNGAIRVATSQPSPPMPQIQVLLGAGASTHELTPHTRPQLSSTARLPPPPLQHTTTTPNTHTRRSSQRRAPPRPRRGPQRGGVPQGSPRGRPTRQCGRRARCAGRPRRPCPAAAGGGGGAPPPPRRRRPPARRPLRRDEPRPPTRTRCSVLPATVAARRARCDRPRSGGRLDASAVARSKYVLASHTHKVCFSSKIQFSQPKKDNVAGLACVGA